MGSFFGDVGTLVWKDLLAEARAKDVLAAGVVFALLVLLIFNLALDLSADQVTASGPGVLWITFIFAGTLGIGRGLAGERDRGTLDGLLLAPIDRSALYVAKTVTNSLLMGVVEAVSLMAFVALFNVRPAWPEMLLVVLLGTIGFCGVGTLVAGMTAGSRAREVLLPVLLFPLVVPVVIASVEATAVAMGAQASEVVPWLQLLLGFDVILVAASFLVFEYVIAE